MTSLPVTMQDIRARAIPLNRQAQIPRQALKQLRQTLKGNGFALNGLAGFLRYANDLLTNAERRKNQRLDVALAIVEFAGCEFWFIRDTGKAGKCPSN
jgi:hypothetical protein